VEIAERAELPRKKYGAGRELSLYNGKYEYYYLPGYAAWNFDLFYDAISN
jgi:hypothetical protein